MIKQITSEEITLFIFSLITIAVISMLFWTFNSNAQITPPPPPSTSLIFNLNPTMPNASTTPPGDFFKIIDADPVFGNTVCYVKIGTGIFCL